MEINKILVLFLKNWRFINGKKNYSLHLCMYYMYIISFYLILLLINFDNLFFLCLLLFCIEIVRFYFTYTNVKSNNNVTTTRLYACSSHILSGRSDPNVAEAVRMWRRQAAAQECPKFVHRMSIPLYLYHDHNRNFYHMRTDCS